MKELKGDLPGWGEDFPGFVVVRPRRRRCGRVDPSGPGA